MKYTVYFTLLSIVFFFSSCRKENVSWDSDWVIPIINDSLDLSNLVNDSTLAIDGSGNYIVDLHRNLIDIGISDFVAIPDTTIEEIFVLSLSEWSFPAGYQFINEIRDDQMTLEGAELKKIGIRSSWVDIYVQNPVPTKVFLTIELPSFLSDGVHFNQTYEIPPKVGDVDGVFELSVPMNNYMADLSGVDGNSYNILSSRLSVLTDPDGPAVLMTDQDVTIVRASFRNIVLDYARGYFGNQIIADTTSFNVDFFNSILSGSIDIPATSLDITVENGMKFDATGKIDYAKNTNAEGNTVNLTGSSIGSTFVVDQALGTPATLAPSSTTLSFNSSNSNIEEYIENLGSKHEIAFSLETNPWGNTSGGWNEVFWNSRFKLNLNASLPLMVASNDLVVSDTFDFSVSQNPEASRVVSGALLLMSENAFPIEGAVKLKLLNANGGVEHVITGTSAIRSSVYGSLNSSGVQTTKSEVRFELTEEMINDLENFKNIVVETTFTTPNIAGTNVQQSIPASAFLGVKLRGDFKLKAVIK